VFPGEVVQVMPKRDFRPDDYPVFLRAIHFESSSRAPEIHKILTRNQSIPRRVGFLIDEFMVGYDDLIEDVVKKIAPHILR
jgi:hypothetical protein